MITVELIPDPELGGFTARIPDLPAYSEGEIEEDAIADLKIALRGYIDAFGLQNAISKISSPIAIRHINCNLVELLDG